MMLMQHLPSAAWSFVGAPMSKPRSSLRVLLIDNYDSYTHNVSQALAKLIGVPPEVRRNDELELEDTLTALGVMDRDTRIGFDDGSAGSKGRAARHRRWDCVVIGPGPGTPEQSADAGVVVELLRHAKDVPILGICFGHQALAAAHGGRVVSAPEPCHGRTSAVYHDGVGVFAGLPVGFAAVRYHSLVVEEATLPACLCVSARIAATAVPGGSNSPSLIMGLAHATRPHFGVQFHPESVATEYGEALLANFCDLACPRLRLAGRCGMKDRREAWRCPCPRVSAAQVLQKHDIELSEDINIYEESVLDAGMHSPATATGMHSPATATGMHSPATAKVNAADVGLNAEHGEAIATAAAAARFSSAAQAGRGAPLRLAWRRLRHANEIVGGSQAIYEKLYADDGEGVRTFWLDSSCTTEGRARFSFMGGPGGPLWHALHYMLDAPRHVQNFENANRDGGSDGRGVNGASDTPPGGSLRVVRGAEPGMAASPTDFAEEEVRLENGLLSYLQKALEALSVAPEAALPFEFSGGYVGHLGYELRGECGASHTRRYGVGPDASLSFADRFVAVDHLTGDVYAVAMHTTERSSGNAPLAIISSASWESATALAASEWVESVSATLVAMKAAAISPPPDFKRKNSAAEPRAAMEVRRSRKQYMADVQACLDKIAAGETYEVCLTTAMELSPSEDVPHPLRLYRELRAFNPAPYAAYIHNGPGAGVLCCSSPERFLRVARNGTVEAKPIKGTAPRQLFDTAADESARAALAASEKDRAENLMIVDLLRNDFGRVCVTGSVHVPRGKLFEVESFASVHQLVSTVRGALLPNVSAIECVRASFPGGSMTGAPKLRTMDIIDHIERAPRGPYSGALGYFSACGACDLNIVIRTVMLGADGGVRIGAGGAVVALSNPADEHDEMLLKARAPSCAIRAALV